MKNIIIGNGVNIHFGGLDYTNQRIIKRALNKLEIGDFHREIYSEEIGIWINMLHKVLPDILKGDCDKYALNDFEKKELENIKKRYTIKTRIYDIGFEDFFLLTDLLCRKLKQSDFRSLLRNFFLDSIYNDGRINQVYKNFSKGFIDYIGSFDNIFTTNYDKNIEEGVKRDVLYLHGAFHVLDFVFDDSSLRNKLQDRPVDKTPPIKGYEHIFSTALTGSSGEYKQYEASLPEITNSVIEKIKDGNRNNPELALEMEEWKDSSYIGIRNLCEAVQLSTANPELKFSKDYALSKLNEIEGGVSFIGLSPNNDSHILSAILNNNRVDCIEFYYFETKESDAITSYFYNKKVITKNVNEFWDEITSA